MERSSRVRSCPLWIKSFFLHEFFTESRSTNTLENVTEDLDIYDLKEASKVLYVCQSFAARRYYPTLRIFLPTATLLQRTFDLYRGILVTRENWSSSSAGRETVWAEFSQTALYGKEGVIAYEEVSSEVDNILRTTQRPQHQVSSVP